MRVLRAGWETEYKVERRTVCALCSVSWKLVVGQSEGGRGIGGCACEDASWLIFKFC